jgi:cellulose biosynthesis protein BcsQ
MAKPAVILVGADKGGVGKTTVSRALLVELIVLLVIPAVYLI